MANTIGFGRSFPNGGELIAEQWEAFQRDVREAVEQCGGEVIFVGTGDGIWQGEAEQAATVVFLGGELPALRRRLRRLAFEYRQDAIALSIAPSELLTAAVVGVA